MRANSLAFRALAELAATGAEMKSAELSEQTGIAAQNIGRITDSLRDAGYIERRDAPPGDRGFRWVITEAGRNAVASDGEAPTPKAPEKVDRKAKAKATPAAKKSAPQRAALSADTFKAGIFSDGTVEIVAAAGRMQLTADEASALAGFCAMYFGD